MPPAAGYGCEDLTLSQLLDSPLTGEGGGHLSLHPLSRDSMKGRSYSGYIDQHKRRPSLHTTITVSAHRHHPVRAVTDLH